MFPATVVDSLQWYLGAWVRGKYLSNFWRNLGKTMHQLRPLIHTRPPRGAWRNQWRCILDDLQWFHVLRSSEQYILGRLEEMSKYLGWWMHLSDLFGVMPKIVQQTSHNRGYITRTSIYSLWSMWHAWPSVSKPLI